MADILEAIAAYKRTEVTERKAVKPLAQIEAEAATASAPRGFRRALDVAWRDQAQGIQSLALIAEIKKASPSKGLIRADFDPPVLARAYADGGAACLSILTDAPSFQGSEAYFLAARAAVDLPCIRKDFLVDPWQVAETRALGADAILVIMAMLDDAMASTLMRLGADMGMDALVEVHDAEEFDRALGLGATLIGVNNRNLRTFDVDLATTEALAARTPEGVFLVTESGLFTRADVMRMHDCGARAMLVGESLMRQSDVTKATRDLLGLS